MNKRYQYKAKRIDGGDWVFGNLYEHEPPLQCFKNKESEKSKFYILKTSFADWDMPRQIDFIEVDGNTICQYIENEYFYENDILFGVEKDGCGSILSSWYGWIKYDKNTGRIRIIDDLGDWYETDDFTGDKVIGNIFDNKDYINLFKYDCGKYNEGN